MLLYLIKYTLVKIKFNTQIAKRKPYKNDSTYSTFVGKWLPELLTRRQTHATYRICYIDQHLNLELK